MCFVVGITEEFQGCLVYNVVATVKFVELTLSRRPHRHGKSHALNFTSRQLSCLRYCWPVSYTSFAYLACQDLLCRTRITQACAVHGIMCRLDDPAATILHSVVPLIVCYCALLLLICQRLTAGTHRQDKTTHSELQTAAVESYHHDRSRFGLFQEVQSIICHLGEFFHLHISKAK